MVKYVIRSIPSKEKVKDLVEAAIGVRPEKVVMSMHVDVTELEFLEALTPVQQKLMKSMLLFDERIKVRVK